MIQTTQLIVWWAGAVAVLGLLSAATFALAFLLKEINQNAWRWTLQIAQLSTARYWVTRMEREGLTACRKEYRSMVSERNPVTADEHHKVEAEAATSKEQP